MSKSPHNVHVLVDLIIMDLLWLLFISESKLRIVTGLS